MCPQGEANLTRTILREGPIPSTLSRRQAKVGGKSKPFCLLSVFLLLSQSHPPLCPFHHRLRFFIFASQGSFICLRSLKSNLFVTQEGRNHLLLWACSKSHYNRFRMGQPASQNSAQNARNNHFNGKPKQCLKITMISYHKKQPSSSGK